MKSSPSLAWVFPLAVCGFAGIGVAYLDTVFTSVTRWAGLLLLALFLLYRGALFQVLRLSYAPALIAWLAWNVATTLWSEQPALSLVKSLAMALTAITFVSGGLYWARSRPASPLSYLAPFAALALFTALPWHAPFVLNSSGRALYEGLASSPNFLGEVAAIGLSYALYALLRAREGGEVPALFISRLIVAVALLAALWFSGSRAAMLGAAPVALVFAIEILPRRIALAGASCIALVVAAALILPSGLTASFSRPVANWATKGRSDLLFSRERTWELSYRKAREGGVAGLGFGVSAGATGKFELGRLTAVDYTREKSNAQLAMIEETGLIGLAAFLAFLLPLFSTLFAGVDGAGSAARLELRFITGLLLGLIIHSVFESWWTAPGAMEAAVFWASVGIAGGLLERLRAVHADDRIAGAHENPA